MDQLLQNYIGEVKIRTDCAGNISRPFETIDDLIAYQNSKPKEILCIYLTARSEDYSDSDKEITSLAVLLRNTLLAFALLFWGLGMFFNKLRDFFFPPIVFTTGHGKSRFKNKERLQWVVIIGFVVSLAAGLVVPIIMTLLRIF